MYGRRESTGFLKTFSKMDFFPRIDEEATSASGFGCVLTFVGIALSILLATAHLNEYQDPTIETEFYVLGSNRTSQNQRKSNSMERTALYVDFNITFTKMPCNYLTVDYYDVFGTRDLDINDKIKLNTFGNQDGHESSTRDTISTSTGRRLLQIEGEDKKDPLDVMPNDGPTIIELKDLEEMAKLDGKESEIHPSAIVIKIGEEERHVVPGGGEHQLIESDHPIHKKTEGKAQLLETLEQFDTFVHENDVAFVNFFAPWCHWCRQFAPVWDATSNTIRELDEPFAKRTKLAKVNCEASQQICEAHQVRAFPTVKIYRAGSTVTHKQYVGDRTVSAIVSYARNLPLNPDASTQFGPEMIKKQETETCVAWRQTKNCDPNGVRESENDAGCKTDIKSGASGYCECKDGIHANPVACVHPKFDCNTMCRRKMKELEEKGDKAKEHEQFLAYMRKSGTNKVGELNAFNAIIQKKLWIENFKESHRGDTMSHEPENRDDLTLGCQASGKFRVGLIPGSLIFTAYSPWHSFDKESVDMTHRVDKFMFGPQTSIFAKHLRAEWEVTKSLEKEGYHMNSMAGQVYESESKEKKTHEHYLRLMQTDIETKIVRKFSKSRPVYNAFSGMIFKTFQTFQYAVNTHTIKEDEQELPSVRFVWDMDPIGVEIKLERKSMYEFITSLLAIIGGVFTLFGIVDSSVYSITKRLCKRRGSSASSSKNGSSSNHHAEGGNGTSKMYPTSVTGGLVY